MKAGDTITGDIVSIEMGHSVSQAAPIMLFQRIIGLPVLYDNGVRKGIVTEGDFRRRLELPRIDHNE